MNVGNVIPFNNAYNWLYAEVTDEVGIAGQGNSNPAVSFFAQHQLAFVDGKYYDPSYGKMYSNSTEDLVMKDIENEAIGGYWWVHDINEDGGWPVDEPLVNLDINGNGNKTDMGVNTTAYLFRKDSTTAVRIKVYGTLDY